MRVLVERVDRTDEAHACDLALGRKRHHGFDASTALAVLGVLEDGVCFVVLNRSGLVADPAGGLFGGAVCRIVIGKSPLTVPDVPTRSLYVEEATIVILREPKRVTSVRERVPWAIELSRRFIRRVKRRADLRACKHHAELYLKMEWKRIRHAALRLRQHLPTNWRNCV